MAKSKKPKYKDMDAVQVITDFLGYDGEIDLNVINKSKDELRRTITGLERLVSIRKRSLEQIAERTRMQNELPDLQAKYEKSLGYTGQDERDEFARMAQEFASKSGKPRQEEVWELKGLLDDILDEAGKSDLLKASIDDTKRSLKTPILPDLKEAEIQQTIYQLFKNMGLKYDVGSSEQTGPQKKANIIFHQDNLKKIETHALDYLSGTEPIPKKQALSRALIEETLKDIGEVRKYIGRDYKCPEKEEAEINLVLDLCRIKELTISEITQDPDMGMSLFELKHQAKQVLKELGVYETGLVGLCDKIPYHAKYVASVLETAKIVSKIDVSKSIEQSKP